MHPFDARKPSLADVKRFQLKQEQKHHKNNKNAISMPLLLVEQQGSLRYQVQNTVRKILVIDYKNEAGMKKNAKEEKKVEAPS